MNRATWISRVVTLAAILIVSIGVSPANAADKLKDLGASFVVAKMYPSLAPRVVLRIKADSLTPADIRELDLLAYDTYVLRSADGKVSIGNHVVEKISTSATAHGLPPDVLYVFTTPGALKKDQEISVGLRTRNGDIWWDVDPDHPQVPKKIKVPGDDLYTAKATPSQVNDAELTNGKKKSAYHLDLDLDVPVLFPNEREFLIAFDSKNTLSSQSADKASALEGKLTLERNLTRRWYTPLVVSSEITSNQRLDEVDSVTSAGIRTILPWRVRRGSSLYNGVIQVPFSPTIEISSQYRYRAEKATGLNGNVTESDDFRVYGEIHLAPVYLFVGTQTSKNIRTPKHGSANNVMLDLLVKAWYLPDAQQTGGGRTSRFYDRFEANLYIPLGSVTASAGSLVSTAGNGTLKRIKLSYRTGANDASNFVRSTEFTVGIEVLK